MQKIHGEIPYTKPAWEENNTVWRGYSFWEGLFVFISPGTTLEVLSRIGCYITCLVLFCLMAQ